MANTATSRLPSSPSFSFMPGAFFPARRLSRQSKFAGKSAEAVRTLRRVFCVVKKVRRTRTEASALRNQWASFCTDQVGARRSGVSERMGS